MPVAAQKRLVRHGQDLILNPPNSLPSNMIIFHKEPSFLNTNILRSENTEVACDLSKAITARHLSGRETLVWEAFRRDGQRLLLPAQGAASFLRQWLARQSAGC